jgi:hypothetical protein
MFQDSQFCTSCLPYLHLVQIVSFEFVFGKRIQPTEQRADGVVTRFHAETSLHFACALVYFDASSSSQWGFNYVLPVGQDERRFVIPYANFDMHFHISYRANHDHTGRGFDTVRNVLVGPIFGGAWRSTDAGVPHT